MAPQIIPYLAHAHSLVLVPALTGEQILTSICSLRYSLNHYYSIFIQRASDGMTIQLCTDARYPILLPQNKYYREDER